MKIWTIIRQKKIINIQKAFRPILEIQDYLTAYHKSFGWSNEDVPFVINSLKMLRPTGQLASPYDNKSQKKLIQIKTDARKGHHCYPYTSIKCSYSCVEAPFPN
jgi:hypothetical protein